MNLKVSLVIKYVIILVISAILYSSSALTAISSSLVWARLMHLQQTIGAIIDMIVLIPLVQLNKRQ